MKKIGDIFTLHGQAFKMIDPSLSTIVPIEQCAIIKGLRFITLFEVSYLRNGKNILDLVKHPKLF